VILLQDVPKVGEKYDSVNVAPGYGQNFLIARGLAKQSTKALEEQVRGVREKVKKKREESEEMITGELVKISKKPITIKAKVNEKGHLFAGISGAEIAKAINEQSKINLATENIILKNPIKEIGEYNVPIKVGGKEVRLQVIVEAE